MARRHARIGPRRPVRVFLREHREAAGLTQQQLAARLSNTVTGPTVSRWENMNRVPNLNIVAAIAEALGLDLTVLFRPPEVRMPVEPKNAPAVTAEAIAAEVVRQLRRRS